MSLSMPPLAGPLPRIPRAGEILQLMKSIVTSYNAVRNDIVNNITPSTATFDNVIRPLADLQNATHGDVETIYLLEDVVPGKESREASIEARKLFLEAEADWIAREDLFALVKAVHGRGEDLDRESRLWVEQELQEFASFGHGRLDTTQITTYKAGKAQLEELERQYFQNLSSDRSGAWFTDEELDGVAPGQIVRWPLATEPPHQGQRFVPFAGGGGFTVMAYASKMETRKKMFLANEQKLPENVKLIKDIAILRNSQARLLGFSSHAEFRLQKRIVKKVEEIEAFMEKLSIGFRQFAKRRLENLQEVRRQDVQGRLDNENTHFPPWDTGYYVRLLGLRADIDQKQISEYFPLETTTKAMLNIFAAYLQLRFTRVPREDLDDFSIWNDDVEVWSVWDKRPGSEEFIGHLYMDLLWREDKHQGFRDLPIEGGYLKADGSRQYPSTVLICAFPPATENACALLKHEEVTLLFHELGHGMHDLVSKTRYVRHSGARLPGDLNETPSIMLETWCWMEDVLRQMSCHYTTLGPQYLASWREAHPDTPDPPTKIPGELLQGLLKNRNSTRSHVYVQQLILAMFDMKLHNPRTPEELQGLDLSTLWCDLRAKVQGIDNPKSRTGGLSNPNIPMIISSGGAGSYGYLSATSYAQDIFATIFAADPSSTEAWDRYRRGILEYGGSHGNELKMLEDLLGRPTNPDALFESLQS